MINPVTKGLVALATAMGYGKESDYKGTSVAEVLSEVFTKMGYGKKSDYKVSTVTDVLYDAAKIAKDKGGPGGDDSVLDDLIESKSGIHLVSNAESVADFVFASPDGVHGIGICVQSIDLPKCTSIGSYSFASCNALSSINLPNVTSIGANAFYGISSAAVINLGTAEGEISDAPWGAPEGVTINYNVT